MDRFKSVNKAISVLKRFNLQNLELSASEISKQVGMHRVTAHRLLETLLKAGLLEKSDNTSKYRIGPELYILGSLYLNTTDVVKAAEPVVKVLNDLTSESVSVSVLDSGFITLVMREESKYGFRWATHIGSIQPAYAPASGKALLSELSEVEIDRFYPEERLRPITKKTITTKTELKLELERIKKAGIAFCREELFDGIEGIAYVIRGANGKAVAAIGIGIPVFRIDEQKRERLAKLVKLGCSLSSYRLGYQDINSPVHTLQEIYSWWGQNQEDSDL